MSICGGVAGRRGRNPVGIFIHNDAGGGSLNAAYWANALASGRHNKENGYAHAYAGSDGVQQVEDDANCAWHCGNTDGNTNYLSIEVCQSMGDLNTFKQNEERALQWCAQKCKQYGITPNENTIRLHQEVYATACPHRSVEIHGGATATKAYFIKRIKELMDGSATNENSNNVSGTKGETTMQCVYSVKGEGCVYYFDGQSVHPLSHPDELNILTRIYRDNNGKDMPSYQFTKQAPWHARLEAAAKRIK